MRAFALSSPHSSSHHSLFLLQSSSSKTHLSLLPVSTNFTSVLSSPTHNSTINPLRCSDTNSGFLDDFDDKVDEFDDDGVADYDGDDGYLFSGEESERVTEDRIFIEVAKLGKNSRRILSKISIKASLDAVWNILTDYEKLADVIPGLAVSEVLEKKDNFARIYQIGQQSLPLGLKFNAKAVLDCYEKELESFDFGKRRDIEFKMTEGDFQVFQGKWSLQQLNKPRSEDNDFTVGQEFETVLSYFVDVKPKLWLPVNLIEGRICKEIKMNLTCIREEAQKVNCNALPK